MGAESEAHNNHQRAAEPPVNSSVTLDFGAFDPDLFNTPGNPNATINNIPPDFNLDQKNSIKISFDNDMANESRLSKKRAYADSTIQIQESSSGDPGEEYEEEQDSSLLVTAPPLAQDCKIVLNLFEDEITLPPPAKKKKVEIAKNPEPFLFKSQLPPSRGMMPPPDPVVKEIK